MVADKLQKIKVSSFLEARTKILELASGIGWTVLLSEDPWKAEAEVTAFRNVDVYGNPGNKNPPSTEECIIVTWPMFGTPVKISAREVNGEEMCLFIKRHPDLRLCCDPEKRRLGFLHHDEKNKSVTIVHIGMRDLHSFSSKEMKETIFDLWKRLNQESEQTYEPNVAFIKSLSRDIEKNTGAGSWGRTSGL